MERKQALEKLRKLIGHDLVEMANKHGIAIFKGKNKNKGWAGQVIERELGLPQNSSRSPNFGSWELKLVSLKRKKDDTLRVKETMAICMINSHDMLHHDFEQSHLWQKIQKMVVVAREWYNVNEPRSEVRNAMPFNLIGEQLEQIKRDYELVQESVRKHNGTLNGLSGRMGVLIQPRTKGPGGDAPKTRAFYARTGFIHNILGMPPT